jgi:flagellar biosynthesis protein FlhB
MSDKTEEPTPKRLRKAREDGDSPLSTFASQAFAFVTAVAIAPAAVTALVSTASRDLRAAIARAAEISPSVHVNLDVAALAGRTIALSLPIIAASATVAAAASLIQTGGVVSLKRVTPDFSKLDVIPGLRQLGSTQRLMSVFRAFVFGAAVAWIVERAIRDHAVSFVHAAGRIEAATGLGALLALDVAKKTAVVGLALAVLDVVVTRRAWFARLRMTKAEVKREHKESEGDPQLKAARERAHHEMLAAVAIANVRHASVVVVNPTHIACALEYEPSEGRDQDAPVVVASGRGDLARRIIDAAHQYGVPVLRDVPLARALAELEVGDEIPEALYEAVAEILREAWMESGATGEP